jgi:homoserine dehydrogenase
MVLDLILIGFGHVGRRFATLIDEERARLAHDYDLTLRIVGIATRHGEAFDAGGLPASSESFIRSTFTRPRRSSSSRAFLRRALARGQSSARNGRLVVVESTTLDIRRGEPATSHIRAALAAGAHVVTVNKGPVAFSYGALARAAARAGRRFLFEGAVMDGVPVFNLVRDTLPAVRVLGFRGVVNSTTNYILDAMERGDSFDSALREMQAAGIAEADASLDVDGWDAAAKTAALANVLLGAAMTPRLVKRRGIGSQLAAQAVGARAHGRRLKLVARAAVRRNGRVAAAVAPEELPEHDLLAELNGQQNALILKTDLLGEIAIVQRSSSLTQTAYALLSDLVTIAREARTATATRRPPTGARRGRSRRSPARRSS